MEDWKYGSTYGYPSTVIGHRTKHLLSTVNRQPDWAIPEIRTKFADSKQHVWLS
jgi:hypothetical protein